MTATLFQRALADRWERLPPEVRALHSGRGVLRFAGSAEVTRGRSWIARFAAACFGFPPAAERVPLTVTMTCTERGETWERNFDGHVFRSWLAPADAAYRYRERFGPFDYELELPVDADGMHFVVRRGWLLGVPLPRCLLPASDAREYVEDGTFRFDVALGAPLGGGLIVRYRGWLRAADP